MQVNSKWGVPFPELPAYQYNDKGSGIAWCEYCQRYHIHGNTTDHKGAHCDYVSPYKATGYILVDMGKAPPWMLNDYLRKYPYGKPENRKGAYEHYFPTLTGKKADSITLRNRRMPQPMRREAIYKMWLPFGKWVCHDGNEVLFNFYNEPIWERGIDGKAKLANPYAPPEDVTEEIHFYDADKPPHKSKRIFEECMYVLSKFGISQSECNIPYKFLEY